MSNQIYQPIRGLATTRSKISVSQYNRMVGVSNGLQADALGSQGVVSSFVAGNMRFRVHRKSAPVDTFPWDKVLFGYSISGNIFTVLAGEIHFKDQIYTCTEADLTIAATDVYVYVEMEWGTGICAIKQDTDKTKATASDSHFRKWLYQLTYVAPSTVSVKLYGHTGGAISIMPVLT